MDRQNTVMDGDEIEKQRGITIFADQAFFTWGETCFYLLDTPGHADFGAETERALEAMDYAVVLLDASAAVSARTAALFRLLRQWEKPVFFFINKMDLEGADIQRTLESVCGRLTEDVVFLDGQNPFSFDGAVGEFLLMDFVTPIVMKANARTTKVSGMLLMTMVMNTMARVMIACISCTSEWEIS